MYSRYLEYGEAAAKAAQMAAVESEHKDIMIGQLKNDVWELRQIQGDYLKLNELILGLQQKYSLLLDEKDRCEREQRVKTDIDQGALLALRQDIDLLRIALQKGLLHSDDLIRENTIKKRMNDARLQEIHATTLEINNLQATNERLHAENKDAAASLRALKEERKRLQEECDRCVALLDGAVAKLKTLEKSARQNESVNARLDKTLHLAESDNQKLILELKAKTEDAKRTESRLRTLLTQIKEAESAHSLAVNEAEKYRAEAANNAANAANEIAKGKELTHKLLAVEANIRAQEQQLDQIIAEEEKQRKTHFMALDQNKVLNGELDRLLTLIAEFEQINRELVDEIQIYAAQDDEAISILNRREQMKELINTNIRKIATTGEHIKQIKY